MSDWYRQHEWIMWRVGELFDELDATPEWRVFKYAGILKKINNMLNRAELLRGRR